MQCTPKKCTGALLKNTNKTALTKQELLQEALEFIDQFYSSMKR